MVHKILNFFQKMLDKINKMYSASLLNIHFFKETSYEFFSQMQYTLDSCINRLDLLRNYFSTNPGRVFSLNRKITFFKVIHFMIELQSKSLHNEIMDYFGHTCDSPSVSALIQQRSKILPNAWFYLFYFFTKQCNKISDPLYKDYRVFACDGSDINSFRNLADKETYISEGENGYNAIHLNALYKLRWSEEASFRELKSPICLINFHSKKRAVIEQKVYLHMILYNFCQMITRHVAKSLDETESSDGKYRYKINFVTAVNICRSYLKLGGNEIPSPQLIKNHINYIKCDVKYPLHLRPKRNKDFIYRTASQYHHYYTSFMRQMKICLFVIRKNFNLYLREVYSFPN